MRTRTTSLAAAAVAAVAALLVAGCSDDANENDIVDNPDSTTPATTSDSANSGGTSGSNSEEGAGDGSESVVAPIIIDGADSVSVTVGANLDVVTPNVTRVETDQPSVLEVSQSNVQDQAEFNAGASVVGAGDATLSVYQDDELLYEVQVSAEG